MLGSNGEKYNISDADVETADGPRGGDNSSLLQGKRQCSTATFSALLVDKHAVTS